MRIRDLQARAVVAPLEPPVRTASGHVTQAPLLLIDLTTDEGIVGRSYLFGYHAFTLAPLRELVVALGEIVKGNVLAPVELDKTMRSRMTLFGTRGLQGVAVAGVDMAAWDALAVRAGVPLAEMLGSRPRPIPAYNSLGMIPPGEAADAAAKTVASGFKALKVKVGWPTLAEDLAVVRAARKHLGDDAALMVDYNQSLATPEAIRRGRVLDGEGVSWIEEPVRADDYRAAAEIAAQAATPIQIGATFNGVYEMELALSLKACDLVMPDPQQIGGVTGWLRAAALAQTAGVPCSSHLFIEVSAHLLTVTPSCHYIEYLGVAAPVLAEPLRPEDGVNQPGQRAGVDGPDRGGAGWRRGGRRGRRHHRRADRGWHSRRAGTTLRQGNPRGQHRHGRDAEVGGRRRVLRPRVAELPGRGHLSPIVARGRVELRSRTNRPPHGRRRVAAETTAARAAGSFRLAVVRPGLPDRRGDHWPISRRGSRSTTRLRGGAAGSPGSSPRPRASRPRRTSRSPR